MQAVAYKEKQRGSDAGALYNRTVLHEAEPNETHEETLQNGIVAIERSLGTNHKHKPTKDGDRPACWVGCWLICLE